MNQVINLGKVFGFLFRVHFTWFIIFILVTVMLVDPNFARWSSWALAVGTSLLFFVSVVAHELAHSLIGRANGMPIESITLYFFGGVAQMTEEPKRPVAELKMAIAGPVCSLVVGVLFVTIWFLVPMAGPVAQSIVWLAIVNGLLAVFNLVPGFPLDGGRVFRALLWQVTGNYGRSTRIATVLGQVLGYLLILGGVLIVLIRPYNLSWFDGMWFVIIGWFLASAARTSYREIRQQEIVPKPANSGTDAGTL